MVDVDLNSVPDQYNQIQHHIEESLPPRSQRVQLDFFEENKALANSLTSILLVKLAEQNIIYATYDVLRASLWFIAQQESGMPNPTHLVLAAYQDHAHNIKRLLQPNLPLLWENFLNHLGIEFPTENVTQQRTLSQYTQPISG